MRINLSELSKDITACLRRFPAEALLGVCFVVLYIIQNRLDWNDPWHESIQNLLPLLPAFYVLTYSLNVLCKGIARVLYAISALAFAPILLWVNLDRFTFSIGFSFTLVLALFVLLACKRKWDNRDFANMSVQTFVDMVIASFISLMLTLAVLAIYASVIYIFDFKWGDLMEYISIFILFVFAPLMFCHLQDKKTEYAVPPFIEIVINYILSPGVVIYTGILYLYIVVIVSRWELPKGGIGYMVLAFVAVTMAGRMTQLIVDKHPFKWFYDYFSWIAIPPLALFWVGSMERIVTYSLTESRVYLLVSGVLTTFYVLLLFTKRLGTYQLMALISAACIVLLTYIPGISAKSIGIEAQTRRMNQYIQQLDMWNDSTQKLKTDAIDVMEINDTVNAYAYRELEESYDYLSDALGSKYMIDKYGSCNISIENQNGYRQLIFSFTKGMDISAYSKYINCSNKTITENELNDGVLTIRYKENGKILMRYDIDNYLNKHRAVMDSLGNDVNIETEPLVYQNDSCLLIMDYLSYEITDNTYKCTKVNTHTLFIK